jgi:hypothetical protein
MCESVGAEHVDLSPTCPPVGQAEIACLGLKGILVLDSILFQLGDEILAELEGPVQEMNKSVNP